MTLQPPGAQEARSIIHSFRGQPVLVVGDLMLDRFIVGKATRISPEAPVPIVRFQSEYSRLGGSGNVARNLAALGARVTLVGIVGTDRSAAILREQLREAGVSDEWLIADEGRPTVEKVRIVTDRNQQVVRLDYEDDRDASGAIEAQMVAHVERAGRDAKVLIVSDYLKGAITQRTVEALVARQTATVPLIVDPKVPHLMCYAGATIITPNHHEAESATNRVIRNDDDARAAAVEFRQRARCRSVLVTRGEHGMWLSTPTIEGSIPSFAREVADVTGAGDTVVATLGLALAAGADLQVASVVANYAAGVAVSKFGPAVVTPEELISAIEHLRSATPIENSNSQLASVNPQFFSAGSAAGR